MSGVACFLVGLVIGVVLGILTMALLMMASATDRELEREAADRDAE